jgi:hypothetical protein
MPLLVVDSRFSRDSRILREAAHSLKWETLRLDGWHLPDWVDANEPDVAIFATMPEAVSIAESLSKTLLACGADWLPQLPIAFRRRNVELTTLLKAQTKPPGSFIKSAITKHLAGKHWTADELMREAQRLHPDLLVLVAEPVTFLVEYRCFIAGRNVAAISPYRRFEQLFDETRPSMNEPSEEIAAAEAFTLTVVRSPDIECPPAFVLDVGLIEGRGWAVVEANECWASGIYHCDPVSVLQVLREACIPDRPRTEAHERWDFAKHYARAVPR